MGVGCDVTDEDQVVAAISRATERFGGVDILVNGAALFNFKGVLNMPVDEWRRQTDIILTGAFLFTKHVAQLMIRQNRKGNIINIISTAGHQGEPGNVGYGTAKAGLINFTRSVAMELAEYGIRVNSLTPTATDPSEGRDRAARCAPRGTACSGANTRRQQRRAFAQAPQPYPLWKSRRLPGIRRLRNDYRIRPARGCRRHFQILDLVSRRRLNRSGTGSQDS